MIPESSPVARGAAYAEVRECVSCHGNSDNPEIDVMSAFCSDVNSKPWHPEYNVACGDVMAYFETVRLRRNLSSRVQSSTENHLITGEQLARDYNCFQCHGHLGQGGFVNKGSLKGYIPGYFGDDFRALTNNADPDSVRQWIMYGVDSKLLKNPITGGIAKFFFDYQRVSMPSFKSLPDEEIETLVRYVIALNEFGPMNAQIVIDYNEQSQSPETIANAITSTLPVSLLSEGQVH